MPIKSENKSGVLSSIKTEGLSLAKNRIRYVPLLAQTINPDVSESGDSLAIASATRRGQFVFDGQYMWATVYGNSTYCMAKYDLRTGQEVLLVPNPTGTRSAYSIAFDGKSVWGTALNRSDLVKVDIATGATTVVGVSPSSFGMAFDGTHIWISNFSQNTVQKIDVNTNSVVATVGVGNAPGGLAFDGNYLWVAEIGGATVSKIDVGVESVVATVNVPSGSPLGLAFDGTLMWVSTGAAAVERLDVATNSFGATVSLSHSANPAGNAIPNGIAFDGTYIWLVTDTATFTRVDINAGAEVDFVQFTSPGTRRIMGAGFDGTHMWVGDTQAGVNNIFRYKILARRD
jgi:YVTN family beta-propeller protein